METSNQQTRSEDNPQNLQSLYGSLNTGFDNNDDPGVNNGNATAVSNPVNLRTQTLRTSKFLTTINSTLIRNIKYRSKFYIIPRENIAKKIFDIFILLCVWYSVISSLLYLGFTEPNNKAKAFDYFIWACFILDFLLKFITESKNKGVPVRDIRGIFIKYARTWMFFDILSLLPLHLSGNPNAEYWLRMFRIIKMPKLFILMDIEFCIDWIMSKMSFLDHKKLKKLTIILHFCWSLFYQILIMLFASYALACIWAYYVKVIDNYQSEPYSFNTRYEMDKLTIIGRLVKTWYFIYTTLMTVGYGDLSATNKYEMGFCIILLIIGPTMYAYAMGKTIDTINRLRSVGKDDERLNNFEAWIISVESNYGKLNPGLKSKLIEHFHYYFANDKANVLAERYWDFTSKVNYLEFHNKFINEIPESLRFQILDHLFLEIFYKFKVFFGFSDNFRYYVCLHIQPRVFRSKTVVIEENTIPSEILFLEKGSVYVGLEDSSGFRSVYKYKDRSIIGDYFVIHSLPSFARYVVQKNFEGFAIPGKVVKKVGKVFKNQFGEITRISDKKAGIIKTNIDELFPNLSESIDDQKLTRGRTGELRTINTRMARGKMGNSASVSQELGLFKDLPKIISAAKRTQGNLLAELNDRLQDLIDANKSNGS